ncbi:threonine/serine ThrE exporter family protein [Flavobacterium sp. RSSA_27]|uniref:threonine/serine ThrE exporter family protein n=1 Tax=Flavobacterium sp. RSSA_27 TaxID=3447667 RepID=UPI003F3814AE
MEEVNKPSKYELGEMLLEIGSILMVSGANTERVKVTISRIAGAFGCDSELMITNHALMITLNYHDKNKTFTNVKWVPNMHLNFNLISEISIMSWKIVFEKWSVERINQELAVLNRKPLYPRFLVLTLVALAGASFCRLFGGDWVEMVACFVASFVGLYVRQEAMKMKFNFYLCVFFASTTAALLSGFYFYLNPGLTYIHALSTSVLFLIPGVPMINSFSDLIDGNILNGITRGVNVLIIAFAIALGLLLSVLIYNF